VKLLSGESEKNTGLKKACEFGYFV